jgi:polysulfide reductase chain C
MEIPLIPQIKMLKILKPQREWKWGIAIYLYLAGMGAGSYIIGLIMDWLGYTPSKPGIFLGYPIDLSKAILLWGPVLVAVGAPFLILDLGRKERFLYACRNPRTSWVARGFIILSIFMIVGIIVLGLSILPLGLGEKTILQWALEITSLIFAFATALYTGILLKSVKYVSLWNTPLLPLLFLISSLSTGSMGILLSLSGYELFVSYGEYSHPWMNTLVAVEQTLILIEGLVLGFYLFFRYRTKDQGESSVRLLVSGQLKFLFWGGIIFIGLIFPIVLEYFYSKFPQYPILLFTTGLFLLSGGFFLRLGVLASGIKDQPPLHKLIEIQSNWRTLKKSQS